jgi:hypothetical protein
MGVASPLTTDHCQALEQPAKFASIKDKADLLVKDQVQQVIGGGEAMYEPKMVRLWRCCW